MKKLLRAMIACVLTVIVIVGAVLIVKTINRPKTSTFGMRSTASAISPADTDASDEEIKAYAKKNTNLK